MKMKNKIFVLFLMAPFFCNSQSTWNSLKYNYNIEIPRGFVKMPKIGSNVDFKAVKGLSSIVIVVKTIPSQYASLSQWEILGDLNTFGRDWENGAQELFSNPKFIKYGKTTISNLESFWFDYTTDYPKLYSKNYQAKKGDKLYTITLTCPKLEYNNYSAIWFSFKEKFKINSSKIKNRNTSLENLAIEKAITRSNQTLDKDENEFVFEMDLPEARKDEFQSTNWSIVDELKFNDTQIFESELHKPDNRFQLTEYTSPVKKVYTRTKSDKSLPQLDSQAVKNLVLITIFVVVFIVWGTINF